MRTFLLSFGSAVALSIAAANAADVVEPIAPLDPVVEPSVYNWTGAYVGAQVGYGWGGVDRRVLPAGFRTVYSSDGFTGGFHAGYNHMIDRFVLGVEGDFDWTGMDGNDNGAGGTLDAVYFQWMASIRGRVGYAIDRTLIYGTGGVAFASIQQMNGTGVPIKIDENYTGWTIGAGIEHAFTDHITTRLEYRYTDFGSQNYAPVGLAPFRNTIDVHAVRLGVSYKF